MPLLDFRFGRIIAYYHLLNAYAMSTFSLRLTVRALSLPQKLYRELTINNRKI